MPYVDGYPDTYSDFYGFLVAEAEAPAPPVAPPLFVVEEVAELPPASNWYVVNSVTGALVGTLPEPNQYEITEPVRDAASQGTMRIPLPSDDDERAELRALLRPDPLRSFSRSIVWEIDGKILFGGPIPSYPYRDGAEIVVPLADWRAWFYHTVVRPNGSKLETSRKPYKSTNQEQCDVMMDLANMARAVYAPQMVVDNPPDSNTPRKITIKMFQGESIGHWLDDLASRDKGPEWGTYMTRSDDLLTFLPHFKVYWPEKRSTKTPFLISYREGDGGNAAAYSWPSGTSAPTIMYAIDGAEDTKLFAPAILPGVKTGKELLWESTVQLADGTTKKADAFTLAKGELKKANGREGEFTMTVLTQNDDGSPNLAFGDYVVGDRFHVILEDNWDALDVPAARCTQRVLSGGAGQPTQQVLTLDINDAQYASDGTLPGYQVFL
jgi:hypothetical protein